MKIAKEIFTDIYKNNLWNGSESVSGTGSDKYSSSNVVKALDNIIKKYNITSIADVGCGDFNWIMDVDLSRVSYTGLDIVEDLISSNIEKYSDESISFMVLDATKDPIPKADLVLVRDVMLHYSIEENQKILNNVLSSGCKYFAINFFTREDINIDINIGEAHLINLMRDPYNLSEPIEMFNEFEGIFPEYSDKVLCLWRLDNE